MAEVPTHFMGNIFIPNNERAIYETSTPTGTASSRIAGRAAMTKFVFPNINMRAGSVFIKQFAGASKYNLY